MEEERVKRCHPQKVTDIVRAPRNYIRSAKCDLVLPHALMKSIKLASLA
jgi:hypothetical protein